HREVSRCGGASTKEAFCGEGDSIGKIATGYAPDVGRSAASGMKKNVEFHARFDCGQRFLHHGQRGLRGEQTGETNQDRNELNDLVEIHFASFDFTLGTA